MPALPVQVRESLEYELLTLLNNDGYEFDSNRGLGPLGGTMLKESYNCSIASHGSNTWARYRKFYAQGIRQPVTIYLGICTVLNGVIRASQFKLRR